MKNHRAKGLLSGTMMLGVVSTSVPMTGCEPVTTSAVAGAAVLTIQQLLQWIMQAAITYTVYKIGDAIYVEIRNALDDEGTQYQLNVQPGDVLEVQPDGTITVR